MINFLDKRFVCPHCQTMTSHNWYEIFHWFKRNEAKIFDSFLQEGMKKNPPEFSSFYQLCGNYFGYGEIAQRLSFSVCDYCQEITIWDRNDQKMIYPLISDPIVDKLIPEKISQDYKEAFKIQNISINGSALLARRCLQRILREQNFVKKDLYDQIVDFLATNPPSYISNYLHFIRICGNWAAHEDSLKVEKNELDQVLEVLPLLFDYFYIQPIKNQNNKIRMNQILSAQGKKIV